MSTLRVLALFLVSWASAAPLRADAVLLLGEPYGRLARFSPTGHVAVYLPRVCAVSPLRLRRCGNDETGVVISRYHRVGGRDWIAVPLIPYLYAVENADDAPEEAGKSVVAELRDAYRRAHFREVVPDAPDGGAPRGNWIQLVGAAYDRRIVAFSVRTTEDQDDLLIEQLNSGENLARFNLLFRNCADFARDIINAYYPDAVRNNVIADMGITTPKQVAKSIVRYAARNPDMTLSVFEIDQIPGSRSRSGRSRGVFEGLVKTKKYVLPLVVAEPLVPTGLALGYLVAGRFNPQKYVTASYEAAELEQRGLSANALR